MLFIAPSRLTGHHINVILFHVAGPGIFISWFISIANRPMLYLTSPLRYSPLSDSDADRLTSEHEAALPKQRQLS